MAITRQIQSFGQINHHLVSVYRSQPVMTLSVNKGSAVNVYRFIYDFEGSKQIVIRTDLIHLPKHIPVHLSYFIDGFEHYFESDVLAAKAVENAGAFIKIRRPLSIRAVNRRNWMRVYPSVEKPVTVSLDLPNSNLIRTPVQDFSANGFSLLVPFDCPMTTAQEDVDSILELPNRQTIKVTVSVKNVLEQTNGVRIGAEIQKISEDNKKKLTDYMVAHVIEHRGKQKNKINDSLSTLCFIHDNCKMKDTLAYLEQPYHLIRHDLQSDWKNMLSMSPDALLFHLDSINPSQLLTKLRSFKKFADTPAIVIADENHMDIACDAIILSQLNDPAALIETIEQTISTRKDDLERGSATQASQKSKPRLQASILIIDLIGDFSRSLIDALESQAFRITMNNGITKMLDTILRTKPVAIVINAKIDGTLKNLIRLLQLNKHTKALPLILLSADLMADRNELEGNWNSSINLLPVHSEPTTLARHIAGIADNRQ